mmetsp:Transcript_2014/g.7272  ORF Transcript_2014/g.7272 Transcript_2014/m.7272 type:complete len:261 (+) Transcript_2014:1032-1814(+)
MLASPWPRHACRQARQDGSALGRLERARGGDEVFTRYPHHRGAPADGRRRLERAPLVCTARHRPHPPGGEGGDAAHARDDGARARAPRLCPPAADLRGPLRLGAALLVQAPHRARAAPPWPGDAAQLRPSGPHSCALRRSEQRHLRLGGGGEAAQRFGAPHSRRERCHTGRRGGGRPCGDRHHSDVPRWPAARPPEGGTRPSVQGQAAQGRSSPHLPGGQGPFPRAARPPASGQAGVGPPLGRRDSRPCGGDGALCFVTD